MATQIVMSKPSGLVNGTQIMFPDGSMGAIGADGRITVDSQWVNYLEGAGFLVVGEAD